MKDIITTETAMVAALTAVLPCDPLTIGDRPVYPCMSYETNGSDPQNTMCGRSDLTRYAYQFDVYADDRVQLLTACKAIKNVMDDFGICTFESDAWEPVLHKVRRVLFYALWDKEAL